MCVRSDKEFQYKEVQRGYVSFCDEKGNEIGGMYLKIRRVICIVKELS